MYSFLSDKYKHIRLSNCRFPHLVSNPRDKTQILEVPCRHCANCRINRRAKLEAMANFELLDAYQSGKSASFVTLTYTDDYVPVKAFAVKSRTPITTLDYGEFRRFMWRVRKQLQYEHGLHDFKYIACGEYGDGLRPHYHFAAIGVDPLHFERVIRDKWYPRGMLDVGALSSGGLRYIISYLDTSIGGRKAFELYNKCGCEPPKVFHSVNLGMHYVATHLSDFQQSGMCYNSKGRQIPLPASVRHRFGDFGYKIPDSAFEEQIAVSRSYDMDVISYLDNLRYLREYDNINCMREKGVPFSQFSLLDAPFGASNNRLATSQLVQGCI